ncbi:MAG: SulP family inorganic anion transporter [Leptolyngbyaceae bacterium]|nr:SulP family inorganic anion transporter [Leptolyngbyaceae bacterium]
MAYFPKNVARQLVHGLHFHNVRGDCFGGVTAAIVALPLALAFGVSSGAGAIAGLYGAIIVGFFAALFGGTPSQISGPTGPMTVVMGTVFIAVTANNPENGVAIAFTIVMLGGLFQILFGLLQIGKYVTLMPYTVISGFMSGVGIIIILIELGPLLGHPSSANVMESIHNLPTHLQTINPAALSLGILTLAIVFGMPRRLNQIIPSPLFALIVGTLVSVVVLSNGAVPRIGEIPTGLPTLHLPVIEFSQLKTIFGYGLMLGILGSIDSLLTSLVADNITQTQHDSDRELIGQGIGNMISGLCGGLPGAGATMRTVVNVKAGGRTPLSGIVHALMLLLIVFGAGELTEPIPHAVLAGILIKVGIDIIDWSFLKRAHRVSLKAAGVMYGVVLLTVFVDLVTAVGVGVFVANMLTIKRLTDFQIESIKAISDGSNDRILNDEERYLLNYSKGKILLFHLSGPMSFGAAKAISQQLSLVRAYDVLILDLAEVPQLGVTASLAIENMVKEANNNYHEVYIVGAHGEVEDRLHRLHVFDRIPADHLVMTRLEALQKATHIVEKAVVDKVQPRIRRTLPMKSNPIDAPLPIHRRSEPATPMNTD